MTNLYVLVNKEFILFEKSRNLENDKIIGSCEYEDEAFDYPSLFP